MCVVGNLTGQGISVGKLPGPFVGTLPTPPSTAVAAAAVVAATAVTVVFSVSPPKKMFFSPSLGLCQLLCPLPALPLHVRHPPLRRHPVGVPAVDVLHPGHSHGGAKLVRALQGQGRVDNVEPREERGHLGQGIVVGAVDPKVLYLREK